MKQNKGFTLIELLAVIVILAIIALIATPIVLNMINSARKSAAKSSSLGYVDAIEHYAGFTQANDDGLLSDTEYKTPAPVGTCIVGDSSNAACTAFLSAVKGKLKGEEPKANSWFELDANGAVVSGDFLYGKYTCHYEGNNASGINCDASLTSGKTANATLAS